MIVFCKWNYEKEEVVVECEGSMRKVRKDVRGASKPKDPIDKVEFLLGYLKCNLYTDVHAHKLSMDPSS